MNKGKNILVLTIFVSMIFSECWAGTQRMETSPESSLDLVYYSDYFSFTGRDGRGYVAFAMDNNRGRDGDTYQAEHFLVLHDEREGWVELLGNGGYENRNKELEAIPDSPYFRFSGSAAEGFLIKSGKNDLKLKIGAMVTRISRSGKDGLYEMGSSDALLEWRGRSIKGRVIYEYLYKPGFNRLTRGSFGVFKDFHGLYLMINGTGDLYFHHRKGKPSSITKNEDGFLFLNGGAMILPFSEVKPSKYRQAFGFYRWPMRWEGKISLDGKPASIHIDTVEFKVIKGWIIGGFAMSIAHGTLEVEGKRYSLYGFAELII
jgi:hypothetical protein